MTCIVLKGRKCPVRWIAEQDHNPDARREARHALESCVDISCHVIGTFVEEKLSRRPAPSNSFHLGEEVKVLCRAAI